MNAMITSLARRVFVVLTCGSTVNGCGPTLLLRRRPVLMICRGASGALTPAYDRYGRSGRQDSKDDQTPLREGGDD
jgi:hypothetical protein